MKKRLLMLLLSGLLLSGCAVKDTNFKIENGWENSGQDEDTAPAQKPQESKGLTFLSKSNGTCYVVDMGSCKDLDLVIPEVSPSGDKVVGIWSMIGNGVKVRSVWIPESVTEIRAYAFQNFTALESVYISNGVTHIRNRAFYNCSSLKQITLPSTLSYLGEEVFSKCAQLEEIILPEGVTYIDRCTFSDCSSLKRVYFPKALTYIGDEAFKNCISLEEIRIPQNVVVIGENAFLGFRGSVIEVDEENRVYQSGGNCLIETASQRLILGCKTSVIPHSGVHIIATNAFHDCTNEIIIPGNINKLEKHAIYVSYAVPIKICYEGTVSEWNYKYLQMSAIYFAGNNYAKVECFDGQATVPLIVD
ncbi:MAG: leucine-rich repeat domain-containing protein [Clostridia bacterium]|nr:leucine-rich repeat domain-containing protein [Clostridia bacterium]